VNKFLIKRKEKRKKKKKVFLIRQPIQKKTQDGTSVGIIGREKRNGQLRYLQRAAAMIGSSLHMPSSYANTPPWN